MILVTGDLHGDTDRFNAPEIRRLKKGDALIITGDFGCIWSGDKKEQKKLKALGKHKFNTLFVEGVHENFELLEQYPIEEWCGGLTRKISGNLRQLMRGQYYKIAGKTVFTFGGGQSDENTSYIDIDDSDRWIKELPSDEELKAGLKNLEAHDYKVDFIITYEPPAHIIEFIDIGVTNRNHINTYLDSILDKADFKMWYFGKRHINKLIPPRYQAVFDKVLTADDRKLTKEERNGESSVK